MCSIFCLSKSNYRRQKRYRIVLKIEEFLFKTSIVDILLRVYLIFKSRNTNNIPNEIVNYSKLFFRLMTCLVRTFIGLHQKNVFIWIRFSEYTNYAQCHSLSAFRNVAIAFGKYWDQRIEKSYRVFT